MTENHQAAQDSANVGPQPSTTNTPPSGWQTAGNVATKVANGVVKTSWVIGGIIYALIGVTVLVAADGVGKLLGLAIIAYGIWLMVGAVRGGWRILIW